MAPGAGWQLSARVNHRERAGQDPQGKEKLGLKSQELFQTGTGAAGRDAAVSSITFLT